MPMRAAGAAGEHRAGVRSNVEDLRDGIRTAGERTNRNCKKPYEAVRTPYEPTPYKPTPHEPTSCEPTPYEPFNRTAQSV